MAIWEDLLLECMGLGHRLHLVQPPQRLLPPLFHSMILTWLCSRLMARVIYNLILLVSLIVFLKGIRCMVGVSRMDFILLYSHNLKVN